MGLKRRVGILVFDGVKLLDMAGPSEVSARLTGSAPVMSRAVLGGRA